MSADLTELALKLRARLLSFEDLACFAGGRSLHQLERHVASRPRVRGQDDQCHAAAADLAQDLVGAQPMEDRVHRGP